MVGPDLARGFSAQGAGTVTTEPDTFEEDVEAWLETAACEDECLDRAAGGSECKAKCMRWVLAVESVRRGNKNGEEGE